MHRIQCSEIWGGTQEADLDVCTNGITASLFSRSCEGGKGGDIYYFSVCGRDCVTHMSVADVAGHGSVVSNLSRWVYDILAEQLNNLGGHQILVDLNERVCRQGIGAMTTAAVFSYYNGDANVYFSYAGHPPQLIRQKNDGRWQRAQLKSTHGPANLPLGVMSGIPYEQAKFTAVAGDRIFLYTDGVIEAPNPAGEKFGQQRLLDLLDEVGDRELFALKNAVLEALRTHTGGTFQHDDVTLMVIEIQ